MKAVDGTDTERNLTPVVHMKVLDSFTTEKDRVANLMHRGIGKTTSLSIYSLTWLCTKSYQVSGKSVACYLRVSILWITV